MQMAYCQFRGLGSGDLRSFHRDAYFDPGDAMTATGLAGGDFRLRSTPLEIACFQLSMSNTIERMPDDDLETEL